VDELRKPTSDLVLERMKRLDRRLVQQGS